MTLRTLKRGLILFCAFWMISTALALYVSAPGPEVDAQHRQELERGLGECQERFSGRYERYECASSLLRQESWDVALLWTQRLLIFFGPPIAAAAWFAFRKARLERLREERRHRARLRRLERGGTEGGNHAGDAAGN